jgi:hypothetical protein
VLKNKEGYRKKRANEFSNIAPNQQKTACENCHNQPANSRISKPQNTQQKQAQNP